LVKELQGLGLRVDLLDLHDQETLDAGQVTNSHSDEDVIEEVVTETTDEAAILEEFDEIKDIEEEV
jgi:hypothetical protein